MTRRLDKTLADYVAIAISPVLIMFLVGSLLYFLVEVFYGGPYGSRMNWIFFWFTIAIVLIARISIELGKERAGMYAAALGIAVFLVMGRFAGGSVLVTLSLIGLIWWSAHKLTFDCTLIDETEDASGEGLMQTIGLDKSAANTGPPVSDAPSEPEEEPEGVTSRDQEPSSWWERFRERQKRPHSPGIWVVYFSLAALPLFGIGHWFIRGAEARRYAFLLLVVYVASGLGLLLTTSFLGLRRYLRQRHLEMPPAMAGLWIAIGCIMVVGLLSVCTLLPRPGAELVAEVPFSIDTPHQEASRYDVLGGEAADEDKDGPRSGTREDDQAPPSESEGEESAASETKGTSDEAGSGAEGEKKGTGPGGEKGGGSEGEKGGGSEGEKGGGSEGEKGGGSEGEKGSGSEGEKGDGSEGKKGGGESGGEGKGAESEGEGSQSESQESDERRESRSESLGREGRRESGRQSDRSEEPESQTAENDRSGGSSPRRRPLNPQALLQGAMNWVAVLFKWLLYAVLLGVVLYAVWRNWGEFRAGLARFLEGLREFWARLFGGKAETADEQAAAAEESDGPRRFSDFPDPFATGEADRYSPDELVSYTFEALQAWAREQGWPREPDQTPHEFAQQIGTQVEALASDVRRLADLYCRVAYAPETVPRKSVGPLRELWYKLEPQRRASFETPTSV